jgi:hypothetical protein
VNKTECSHDYDNPVRKGRAHYVCPLCGEDITLALVFINFCIAEERGERKNER